MKALYDEAMSNLLQSWDVAKLVDEYFQNKTADLQMESNFTLDITEDSEWRHFHRLRQLYAYQTRYNWFPQRIGSFLINKLLYELNQWNNNEFADKIDDLFKMPGTNFSISNIANLYSVNDFEQIHDIQDREYLANFPKSYFDCFHAEQDFFKGEESKDESVYEDEKMKPIKYMLKSPCYESRHQESCSQYCQWSNKLFQGTMKRKDFLKIMQFALPQGRSVIEQDLDEETLAMKIFGRYRCKPLCHIFLVLTIDHQFSIEQT